MILRFHVWLLVLCAATVAAHAGAQVTFTDVTASSGVSYAHVVDSDNAPCTDGDSSCQGLLFTGGATVGDYNDDGCPDLFVTRFDSTDLLFENQCDGTFDEVAEDVGLTADAQSNGAVFADIDSDGDLDLYVITQLTSAHLLYINDGAHLTNPGTRPSFSEQAVARGAAVAVDSSRMRQGMSVSAGDFDRDGYLDLFTTEWNGALTEVTCGGTHARLLHNRGAAQPGYFDDVTDDTRALMTFGGIGTTQIPLSFSPAFPDLDEDGWPDLAVAADGRTSQLFWNDANGRFTRGTEAAMVATDEFGMGSTFGDYDNDGDMDWFVTSINEVGGDPKRDGNRLYRNEGGRVFSDQTDAAGVRNGYWGWGAAFFDYDNDGDLDLGHTNGFPAEATFAVDPIRLWRNDMGVMTDVAACVGMTDTRDGRAYLTFDYDDDGDLDVFVTNHNGAPALYRNDGGNAGDWLRVRVRGVASAADGRGTWIEARAGTLRQVRQVGVGSHFLGEGETTAHFGLGKDYAASNGTVDLTVRFVSGRRVELTGVVPNTTIEVVEPAEGLQPFAPCVADVTDCDMNNVIDVCDIHADASLDMNGDGVLDACASPMEEPSRCVRRDPGSGGAGGSSGAGGSAGTTGGAGGTAGAGGASAGTGGSGGTAGITINDGGMPNPDGGSTGSSGGCAVSVSRQSDLSSRILAALLCTIFGMLRCRRKLADFSNID